MLSFLQSSFNARDMKSQHSSNNSRGDGFNVRECYHSSEVNLWKYGAQHESSGGRTLGTQFWIEPKFMSGPGTDFYCVSTSNELTINMKGEL